MHLHMCRSLSKSITHNYCRDIFVARGLPSSPLLDHACMTYITNCVCAINRVSIFKMVMFFPTCVNAPSCMIWLYIVNNF
jgi:hypothetical protein